MGDTASTDTILHAAVHACYTAQQQQQQGNGSSSRGVQFRLDGVLVPLLRGMHWTLALVSFARGRVEYFDSLQGNFVARSVLDMLSSTAATVRDVLTPGSPTCACRGVGVCVLLRLRGCVFRG